MNRIAFLAAAATLAVCAPAAAQERAPEPFLTVTGNAEARVATDRARLDFMVETQTPTAEEAARRNAARMDAVIRALRDAGGRTVTIETGGYDLAPIYRRPGQEGAPPTIEAYRALNHVRVRADDVARVGALIDAAIGAGANRISSLTFEAKDPEPARLEALRSAVAKARAEAEVVAEAMGVALGGPLEVQTGSSYDFPPPMPMYNRMEMAQAAPTPVEPGEQVVRGNVTIRYRLLEP